MFFIDPKTDFAFKKIFGSEQSRDILISFLNGMIYAGEPVIQDLVILDPYQAPRIRGLKPTYLDVKAQLATGESVIIEMQVLNVEGFQKRILYNAAKTYSAQLNVGESYLKINPVIALTITDFIMFEENDQPISQFVLKEKTMLFDYPVHDLELVFVELPKFKTALENLTTLTDKWIYFLRNAPKLRSVPDNLDSIAEIHQAFSLANQAQLSPEERDELDREIFFITDHQKIRTDALTALTRGLEQGLQQGLQQGIEQGLQQGREQGREQGIEQGIEIGRAEAEKETQREIARRLLDLMTDAQIAETTGLPIEDVRSLR